MFASLQKPAAQAPQSPPEESALRARAAALAASMSADALAAQIILSAAEGRAGLPERSRALLSEIPPGGVMLFAYNVNAGNENAKKLTAEINAAITAACGIPPFIAADQEGGAVQRFRDAAAVLPPPLEYRERGLAALEADAERTGAELRRLGVNLNLAPVAEPLTEANRTFLGSRSYGSDPAFAGEAAAAFVRGMGRAGIACTLKHFPGSAAADPHRAKMVILDEDEAELERLIAPFRAAIAARPAAIMLSHSRITAWDGKNASLSSGAVRRLREDFGFGGIIIADDFSMAAVDGTPEQCAVEAVSAGVDMVMAWPGTIRGIHRALVRAAGEGKLARERLESAAARILYEKLRVSLLR